MTSAKRIQAYLPTVLVLGPPKTATTWLYQCFENHPDIHVCAKKQLHFFDREFDKGLSWYQSNFHEHTIEKHVCEITPDYLSTHDCARRIHESLGPDTKLIIIYRDPAERAISEYLMKIRTGAVKGTFEEAAIQDHSLVLNSDYLTNIDNYRNFFNDENIGIIDFSEISNFPDETLRKICQFLEIPFIQESVVRNKVNEGGKKSRFKVLLQLGFRVRKQFEKSRSGLRLINSLRNRGVFKIWHKIVLRGKAGSYRSDDLVSTVRSMYFSRSQQDRKALSSLFL